MGISGRGEWGSYFPIWRPSRPPQFVQKCCLCHGNHRCRLCTATASTPLALAGGQCFSCETTAPSDSLRAGEAGTLPIAFHAGSLLRPVELYSLSSPMAHTAPAISHCNKSKKPRADMGRRPPIKPLGGYVGTAIPNKLTSGFHSVQTTIWG